MQNALNVTLMVSVITTIVNILTFLIITFNSMVGAVKMVSTTGSRETVGELIGANMDFSALFVVVITSQREVTGLFQIFLTFNMDIFILCINSACILIKYAKR